MGTAIARSIVNAPLSGEEGLLKVHFQSFTVLDYSMWARSVIVVVFVS